MAPPDSLPLPGVLLILSSSCSDPPALLNDGPMMLSTNDELTLLRKVRELPPRMDPMVSHDLVAPATRVLLYSRPSTCYASHHDARAHCQLLIWATSATQPPRGYPRPYEAIIYGPVIPRAGTSGIYARAIGQVSRPARGMLAAPPLDA